MKVLENDTDRQAEVHLHVEGKVEPLAEYGEYIDPSDNAICCYVPIEEGHQVKIRGHFSGTTLVIAYDAVIDGVHRKASSYIAKTVNFQKKKNIYIDSFLYKTGEDIIDTAMLAAPISGMTATLEEGIETIGTVELRLYVTRQLGVSHTLDHVDKYDSTNGNDEDEILRVATYKLLPPTLQMTFEKDMKPLEGRQLNQEKRKMEARRPGTEPWATFRFHYRSKEAIVKHNQQPTFNPTSKEKPEPHILKLEPVPPLAKGTKPHKDDGDSSTRASSPAPPDPSSVPTRRPRKNPAPKTPTLSVQQQAELTSPPTSSPYMTSTANKATTKIPESTLKSVTHRDVTEDLRARIFAKPSPKSPSSEMAATTVNSPIAVGGTKSIVLSSDVNLNLEKVADTVNTALSPDKGGNRRMVGQINTAATEAVEEPIEKAEGKEHTGANNTIAVLLPTPTTNDGVAISSSLSETSLVPANGTTTKPGLLSTPITKRNPQVVIPGANRPGGKPAPIGDMTPFTQKKTGSAIPPITPTKRAAESTDPNTPENKRSKSVTPSSVHLPSATMARRAPGSPSPRPGSMELTLAEQRKKLQAVRQKRLETAKKQEELDKKMEPYKQRMAEELERLNREMMEEEAAVAEDEQHYNASMEMLAEFEHEVACD